MITNLNETIEVFSGQIKDKFADYASLYNYFCMFINENYTDEDGDLQEFFTRNLCRRDIINSCVYYMEESNASSVSAIEKYLNSITKLYNEYIKPMGWNSAGLDPILPFSTCKGEVREKIKKSLREKRKVLALKEEEYRNLIEYLGEFQKKTYVGKQISIIFKLILLYGFKFERIRYFQARDFNKEENYLYILVNDKEKAYLPLELPAYLHREIVAYLLEHPKNPEEYMFLNKKGHLMEPSFFFHTFHLIQEKYGYESRGFTTTGLAKYAIQNMIRANLTSVDIKIITGMEDDVIDDCELAVQEEKRLNAQQLKSHVNSKIRTIKTYDEMRVK